MTRDLILIAVDRNTGEVIADKEVVGQIGPVTPSITRIVKAMDIWAHTLGTPATRYAKLYEYLINEGVDLTKAEVKLPEPCNNKYHPTWNGGWNAYRDRLTAQMKVK
jgi:hypothetical protein